MTPVPKLGVLEDVSPRLAWANEAHQFTPWLADNIAFIGDLIGLTLEVEEPEMRVGRFAADLVTRDVRNGERVLIENQLEVGDHGHLGQMLTYLTGLEAKTVIWLAPEFRDEHISAINWLNEHTVDPFAFFAIRIRLVRIGDSLMAPVFEVVAKPNKWDRQIQEAARAFSEASQVTLRRRAFWDNFVKRYPESAKEAVGGGGSSRWRAVPEAGLVVSRYCSARSIGVFVRGPRGTPAEDVVTRLAPHLNELQFRLGVPLGDPTYPFNKSKPFDGEDEANWDVMADWMHAEAEMYAAALIELLPEGH